MNCMIFKRRSFSTSSESWSMAEAFRLSGKGAGGVDTRWVALTTRARWMSGSRHSGGAVAS